MSMKERMLRNKSMTRSVDVLVGGKNKITIYIYIEVGIAGGNVVP